MDQHYQINPRVELPLSNRWQSRPDNNAEQNFPLCVCISVWKKTWVLWRTIFKYQQFMTFLIRLGRYLVLCTAYLFTLLHINLWCCRIYDLLSLDLMSSTLHMLKYFVCRSMRRSEHKSTMMVLELEVLQFYLVKHRNWIVSANVTHQIDVISIISNSQFQKWMQAMLT